jgi:hypothetical protein
VLGFEKYLVWKNGGKSENQLALQFNSVHSRVTGFIAAASFAMEFAFLFNIARALYFYTTVYRKEVPFLNTGGFELASTR